MPKKVKSFEKKRCEVKERLNLSSEAWCPKILKNPGGKSSGRNLEGESCPTSWPVYQQIKGAQKAKVKLKKMKSCNNKKNKIQKEERKSKQQCDDQYEECEVKLPPSDKGNLKEVHKTEKLEFDEDFDPVQVEEDLMRLVGKNTINYGNQLPKTETPPVFYTREIVKPRKKHKKKKKRQKRLKKFEELKKKAQDENQRKNKKIKPSRKYSDKQELITNEPN